MKYEPIKLEYIELSSEGIQIEGYETYEPIPSNIKFSAEIPLTQEDVDNLMDLFDDPDWPSVVE